MSLQIQSLSKSFSIRTLFSNVTFAVNPGDRVALVGSNGSGKTTMMKIILGHETPDEGTITLPKDSRVGYLPQEIFLEENETWQQEKEGMTLWGLVTQAFSHLKKIKVRLETLENDMASKEFSAKVHEEYEQLLLEFEKRGGYSWQAKTIRLLKGFGFPEERFKEPLKNFSGGWQMRGYFARLLLTEPDYLLLDEPTNYLDIASISFLEDYLSSYLGGILVVSHDRYFLDDLANSVVAIMPEGAKTFRGNYSAFLDAREVWAEEAKAAQERQDKERKRVEKFVERFRYKASKASQVQSRIKQLKKIEAISQARSIPKLRFSFPKCEPSGDMVIKAESLSRAYGEHRVLNDVSFSLIKGDRLAIIGENGAGKTTLIRILAGEDLCWSGQLENGYHVRLGYFAQDEEISFENDETVWERMMREAPIDAVPGLRNLLGAFLFSGDNINKKVMVLSGGEKSRLGLARMMLRPCNLLILDEPTNHLDIASREALLNALDDFPGTIVIVSHDRFFLDSLATRVLAIENGKSYLYEGNYSQYLWARKHRNVELENENSSDNKNITAPKNQARDLHKQIKQINNRIKKIKIEISDCEISIENLENKKSETEIALSSPPQDWDATKLVQVTNTYKNLEESIDEAVAKWENLNTELEDNENKLLELKEVKENVSGATN